MESNDRERLEETHKIEEKVVVVVVEEEEEDASNVDTYLNRN